MKIKLTSVYVDDQENSLTRQGCHDDAVREPMRP